MVVVVQRAARAAAVVVHPVVPLGTPRSSVVRGALAQRPVPLRLRPARVVRTVVELVAPTLRPPVERQPSALLVVVVGAAPVVRRPVRETAPTPVTGVSVPASAPVAVGLLLTSAPCFVVRPVNGGPSLHVAVLRPGPKPAVQFLADGRNAPVVGRTVVASVVPKQVLAYRFAKASVFFNGKETEFLSFV